MEFSTRKKLRRNTWTLLPVVLGGMLGYGYYEIIGCATGTCPLTGNPWITTAFGMLIGWTMATALPPRPNGSVPEHQKRGREQ